MTDVRDDPLWEEFADEEDSDEPQQDWEEAKEAAEEQAA